MKKIFEQATIVILLSTCCNGLIAAGSGYVLNTKIRNKETYKSYSINLEKSRYYKRNAFFLRLQGGNIDDPKNDDITKGNDIENEPYSSKINVQDVKKLTKFFWEMAWPYFEVSKSGRLLFGGVIGFTLLNSGISVAFSYLGRDFWTALSSKNVDEFNLILMKYLAALLAGTPISVYYRFQREKLALAWREWMTDRTLQLYYCNRAYYTVERGAVIDNPDQRISEDVRSFTAFSLSFFISIITSIIDLVSFSAILYSIQPQLFGAIICYAAFGTVVTTIVGKNLVGLNFLQLQKEANFRYSLVRLRENAESIAFYGGEDKEGKEVSKRLGKLVDNKKNVITAQRNLDFFTTAYSYMIQIFPIAIVAPQFFAGKIELGVISQSVGAFNHVLNDLSFIINRFEGLSSFTAGIDRLYQFMEAIKNADPERCNEDIGLMSFSNNIHSSKNVSNEEINLLDREQPPLTHSNSTISIIHNPTSSHYNKEDLMSVYNMCLLTPDRKRMLINNLSVSVKNGENLLIVGESGAGKSSFLRALAGLWTAGSGSVVLPSQEDVYFLPQRPYCALGTLKDQLLYPSSTDEMSTQDFPDGHVHNKAHILRQSLSDDDLLQILEDVNLKTLPIRFGDGDPFKGLNCVRDWSNTLSLGEQQRLAFGRLLVNKPRLVILDEATSALDIASEAKMYSLLQSNTKDHHQVTYISVGHRPTLNQYHNTKLILNGDDGNHSFESIKRNDYKSFSKP